MKAVDKIFAEKIYIFLGALFITSLVVSNIIFPPLCSSLFKVFVESALIDDVKDINMIIKIFKNFIYEY